MCCIHIFFLTSFFSCSISIFLTYTNDSHDSRKRRGNHYFSCFPLPLAQEYSFSSSWFLPFLFNRTVCKYQTDNWWNLFSLEICILFAFSLMQLSRSYWLSHFKVTLRGYKLIWNYHPSITKRTAYPTEINTPSHHCLSITPTRLPKCVKNEGSFLPEIWRRISKSIFTVLK